MAEDSDGIHGELLTTVLTCEGDLTDPQFPSQLQLVVNSLNGILGDSVKVCKLEPWNSVRVTLSIPREAALRLRQLAAEGSQQLRALGILSIQVEGDQVVSLRLAAGSGVNAEPQEIILRTSQDGSSNSNSGAPSTSGVGQSSNGMGPSTSGGGGGGDLGALLASGPAVTEAVAASTVANQHVQFKSPNVVCPADSVVPKVHGGQGQAVATANAATVNNVATQGGQKPFAGPFPFTSMNQAIHPNSGSSRTGGDAATSSSPISGGVSLPPPPYPGGGNKTAAAAAASVAMATAAGGAVPAISSPLLVNLLQNDGGGGGTGKEAVGLKQQQHVVGAVRQAGVSPQLKAQLAQQQLQRHGLVAAGAAVGVKSSAVGSVVPSGLITPTGAALGTSKQQQQQQHHLAAPSATPLPMATAANLLMNNNTLSPSALSSITNNTSIRQNSSSSTILTSTTGAGVTKTPPPQYHRTLSANMVKQQQQTLVGYPTAATPLSSGSSMIAQNALSIQQPGQQQTAAALLQNQKLPMRSTAASPMGQPKHPLGISKVHPNMTKMIHNNVLSQQQQQVQHQQQLQMKTASAMQPGMLQQQQQPKVGMNLLQQQQQQHQQVQGGAQIGPHGDPVSAVAANPASLNNVMLRSLPSPPPYSVAISRPWDSLAHSNPLMDLTPTLTDLKADDLDELLPTLERELTASPLLDLPEDFLNDHSHIISSTEEITPPEDNRKFLINPLTGELEPQSSGESDTEDTKDVFTGLPSPAALTEDDDTSSTMRPDTTTDQSDSETRLSGDGNGAKSYQQASTQQPQRLKNAKARDRARGEQAAAGGPGKPEKIKLTLRLEKSEPVNPAYKVDVSFINTQPPKKATATNVMNNAGQVASGEELRVPPLHISLRGRNSVVIKNKSSKVNADGSISTGTAASKAKTRKGGQDQQKTKKGAGTVEGGGGELQGTPTEEEAGNLGAAPDGESGAVANAAMGTAKTAGDLLQAKAKVNSLEQKKKKLKVAHEHKDLLNTLSSENDLKPKFMLHNHYKEKQKERRGSDSELVRHNNKKYAGADHLLVDEKKRRMSQVDPADDDDQPPVLGSTNVGTIAGLPQKIRKDKDKVKVKDAFKKEMQRSKALTKSLSEKPPPGSKSVVVALPVAGEMDMEAKFKQGLLEGSATTDKGVPRPPHRTAGTTGEVLTVNHVTAENSRIEVHEKVMKKLPPDDHQSAMLPSDALPLKKKSSPEPDKCNTPVDSGGGGGGRRDATEKARTVDEKEGGGTESPESGSGDKALTAAQVVGAAGAVAGRTSPSGGNSTSSGQGEDSGIESMDALSEKSPNQASQSPHTDLLSTAASKTQVPNMLDIEAQLAKMEGLNGATDVVVGTESDRLETTSDNRCVEEDVNENHNKSHHDRPDKLKQCCELTCALQDSLKKGTGLLSTSNVKQQTDNLIKGKKDEDDLEPLPVRVTPALYTYSNPEKNTRVGSESPAGLSDEDSNSCSTNSSTLHGKQSKSLLEQLLIEIPNDHSGTGPGGVGATTTTTAAHSPATRSSMRTRNAALSKLGSPADELHSPPIGRPARHHASAQPALTAKRKRNESDGSTHGGGGASAATGTDTDAAKKKVARKTAAQANVGATTTGAEQEHTGVKTRHHDVVAGKQTAALAVNSVKKTSSTGSSKVHQDESSDSDEPLIEKVRKPLQNSGTVSVPSSTATGTTVTLSNKPNKSKTAPAPATAHNNASGAVEHQMNTRRSNRAVNTRSKGGGAGDLRLQDKTEVAIVEAAAAAVGAVATPGVANAVTVRRKTRSADVENKRKKEVK